jgi:2-oxo-3-hexenedioate decarboxylase/2-keto-4-pentenoate hydratase
MEQAEDLGGLMEWSASLGPARLAGATVADPPAPIALATGYRLAKAQARVLGTPAGWKIGATSASAMEFLGVNEPIMGRLYAERVWHDGDRADLKGDRPAEAEPEIAFLLAKSLRAGEDTLDAVGEARAAAEIVRPSHDEPFRLGAGFIVADNAAGLGALIGPPIPLDAMAQPEAIEIALATSGGARCAGTGDAVLGDPTAALSWLATQLGEIPAGSWVLSGAMARAIPLEGDAGSGRLLLDAGPFGTARLLY